MKKKDSLGLYFIALIPDEPIFSDVMKLKEEVSMKFNSNAALRSPPHITLHMPFKWKEPKEPVLYNTLNSITLGRSNFNLELKDFGCFEPRVIYINCMNSGILNTLQSDIMKVAASEWHIYQRSNSRPYNPHMTIAFRDLRKAQFHLAWEEYENRSFNETMNVSRVVLLKHNGKSWDEHQEFCFNQE